MKSKVIRNICYITNLITVINLFPATKQIKTAAINPLYFMKIGYDLGIAIIFSFNIFFVFPFQTASSSGDPHVHVIKEVKPTDEGLYTCIAGNFIGQATASAYLEVNSGFATSAKLTPLFILLMILSLWSRFTTRWKTKQRKKRKKIIENHPERPISF